MSVFQIKGVQVEFHYLRGIHMDCTSIRRTKALVNTSPNFVYNYSLTQEGTFLPESRFLKLITFDCIGNTAKLIVKCVGISNGPL